MSLSDELRNLKTLKNNHENLIKKINTIKDSLKIEFPLDYQDSKSISFYNNFSKNTNKVKKEACELKELFYENSVDIDLLSLNSRNIVKQRIFRFLFKNPINYLIIFSIYIYLTGKVESYEIKKSTLLMISVLLLIIIIKFVFESIYYNFVLSKNKKDFSSVLRTLNSQITELNSKINSDNNYQKKLLSEIQIKENALINMIEKKFTTNGGWFPKKLYSDYDISRLIEISDSLYNPNINEVIMIYINQEKQNEHHKKVEDTMREKVELEKESLKEERRFNQEMIDERKRHNRKIEELFK